MTASCKVGDEMELAQFRLIADKIEADPSLLTIPPANIERWLGHGHRAAAELRRWLEQLLAAGGSRRGMASLLKLLRDDSGAAREWKDFMPCAGLLTEEELGRVSV